MGAQTFETSGYLIRYYQNTDTYVGTINGDFYVLGGAFGNEVVYMGTMEYLLKVINPPETITFAKTFGGTERDNANSVQQTADGGFIIVGETESLGAGGSDVYLLKTDSNGNLSDGQTACIHAQGGEWEHEQCALCDSSHLHLCGGSDICTAAGGYWYDYTCHTAPEPEPTCRLTCSTKGFTYTCKSGITSGSITTCKIGDLQYISSSRTTYDSGHSVICTSSTCGGALSCTDDTGSSCTIAQR